MYDVYVGKRKSLVFPIMCNSHVSVSYTDNIPDIESTPSDTTDDIPYGIWAHEGDWTVEALITPYDINGSGATGRRDRLAQNNRRGVMPANGTGTFLSETYLPTSDRFGHKMCFFKCANFSLYLVNTTTNNVNQPAEYGIRIEYSYSGGTGSSQSSAVITSSNSRSYEYGNANYNSYIEGFTEDGRIRFNDAGSVIPGQSSASAVIGADTTKFGVGQEVFIRENEFDFTLLGTITGVDVPSSGRITLDTSTTSALSLGTRLFTRTYKEPKYIDNIHHIAVAYSSTSQKINMYYNGSLINTTTKTLASEILTFGREDIVIGKKTTSDNNASTDCQFMGEIHELCVVGSYQKSFRYLNSLMPKFSETLLFLQFEEENL
tara:strand:- start:9079 stop:10206 length:1128 start_codon:yes stop_codon:yes gene_type:complete